MNIKFRLLRKPFTTLLWGLLVTVMTVLLCVGGALWYSSESAAETIDQLHNTVAYRTDRAYQVTQKANGVSYSFENKTISAESRKLLESLDSVEAVYTHTLTGGYSPALLPVTGNRTYHNVDESYDDVLVIATISRLGEPTPAYEAYNLSQVGLGGVELGVDVALELKIEEYYIAHDGVIGTGTPRETDAVTMYINFLRESDAAILEEGQRYLIYGAYLRLLGDYDLPTIDTAGYTILDGNSLRGIGSVSFSDQIPLGEELPEDYVYTIDSMTYEEVFMARLEGSVEDFLADPANGEWAKIAESCAAAQHSVPLLGTDDVQTMYIFTNSQASILEGRFFTREEYDSGARVCILSSTLAEQSGIQVGDTIPISQFWCVDEYVTFGDNDSTDLYATDGMLNNPTVGHVGADTEFITRDEEFTVVGIYRQRNEWSIGSYDLTPNTVFIPKKAQIPGGFGGFTRLDEVTYTNAAGEEISFSRAVEGATWGVYLSVKLKNGMAADFREAIAGTELEGQFIVTDQGYSAILDSIRSVSQSARSLFALVGGGWALLLLLYILLYQGSQRRNLGIMRSLGATPGEAGRYLWGSGMAVAVMGVTIGTAVSAGIMGVVQQLLYDAATTTVTLSQYSAAGPTQQSLRDLLAQSQLPLWALLLLGAAQLLFFAAAMYFQARHLAIQEPRRLLGA